jgi:hypothetical protein
MATTKAKPATKRKTAVKSKSSTRKKTVVKAKRSATTVKRTATKRVPKKKPVQGISVSGIKDISDVKKALKTLEKRLKTVERQSESILDKLVESMRLKEIYAKGNAMVSQAYKYTKDKCVGK